MKVSFKDKIKYWFDNLMSRGTVVLVGMLFLATLIVVLGVGIILSLISIGDGANLLDHIWASLMHIIDAGTITAADTANSEFVVLMSIVTLCGIFVTSILIGIITTGFEEKLNNLKKGNSRVIEKKHIVILGYDNNIFTLISELIIANENQKDACIVILCDEDKEIVEEAIKSQIEETKTTRIICRTGSITDINMLAKCSLENCRSIIVNESKDFMTIKAIISINNYFKSINRSYNLPHIVATITKEQNMETVNIISNGNAEVVLVEDTVSRIVAQSCRQPGLSYVLMELFDYDGDELYFENFPELEGKTFGAVLNCFEKAVVFGVRRDGEVFLNPDKDMKIQLQDDLILLVEDDGVAKPVEHKTREISKFKSIVHEYEQAENVLIIGVNDMLEYVILELDEYFVKGSQVFVAHDKFDKNYDELKSKLKNIELSLIVSDTNNRKNLEKLTADFINHVLILSDNEKNSEESDSITLFKLIHLRDIALKFGKSYSITSEMQDVSNQRLAEVAQVNDLVVGSNIINLILAQIAENRDLSAVFQELLQAEGSEIYIRKAHQYVTLGVEMDFYDVTDVLKEKNQIAIGYKKQNGNSFDIIVNPNKSDKIIFFETDEIIALSLE